MKCAVATLAIGEDFLSSYARIFRPSAERYVARHGYDLIVINDYFDGPLFRDPRLINFQKMLLPCHEALRQYDLLMVLDADILITPSAAPFHALEIGSAIGVVDEWSQPSREKRRTFQSVNGFETTASAYYRLAGIASDSEIVINGGMFICSPPRHGPFFRDIVARHSGTQRTHPRAHFQQAMFSHELLTNRLAHLLPPTWNRLWPLHRPMIRWGSRSPGDVAGRLSDLKRFREVFDTTFLLHMAGGLDHDLAFLCRNRGNGHMPKASVAVAS
jgi:hypothetical protein